MSYIVFDYIDALAVFAAESAFIGDEYMIVLGNVFIAVVEVIPELSYKVDIISFIVDIICKYSSFYKSSVLISIAVDNDYAINAGV